MIVPILLFLLPQAISLPTSPRHDITNTACNLLTSDHTAYDCLPDFSLESAISSLSQRRHDIRGVHDGEGPSTCPDGKNTIMYYEMTDWHLVSKSTMKLPNDATALHHLSRLMMTKASFLVILVLASTRPIPHNNSRR
ncbi:hypothetical protein I307_01690 [Cryptococcus deuterogattii 99/473]|uniref:Uncharacterized protein n=1 Tax=Cryptococcus deuterogattii Ram5 TaxID=1296110 RepID=A0A0D0T069_9TREE|nr:hypothetical protein I313_05124 [Cryptococcus deuterogattii Ram5]KIY58890.1 hypothetical protein I307_01690 [Cryptococcus deuterogattii 99/473]